MRRLQKDECFVLIIYDIVNDRRRNAVMRYLNGYGYRVQKSCFEAIINKKMYRRILEDIPRMVDTTEDSVRIYKFNEHSKVIEYGLGSEADYEIAMVL